MVVTGNTFAVYGHSGAVGFAVLEDSVMSRNTFLAGAYPHTVALGTHGGRHVDISANIVNGVDQTHSGNLIGWRAGIFLNHTASQENILVAGNRFSCIGSRSGVDAAHKSDGEAISTDAPGNILSFRSGQWVTDADRNTVTVAADRHDMRLSLRHEEYTGRWIQVDFGPGLGQSRKITDARELTPGHVTFTVSPPFDVVPSLGSRIIIYQQTWQTYIVDKAVDNACSHTLSGDVYGLISFSGGLIGVYNSISDSVIEANTQIDTAGIRLSSDYNVDDVGLLSTQRGMYFLDVRGNTIDGTFGSEMPSGQPHRENVYGGGINLASQISASLNGVPIDTPDFLGFGVSVAGNKIRHAALMQWGASNTWAVGIGTEGALAGESPVPGYVDTHVFGNDISDVPDPWRWPEWWDNALPPRQLAEAIGTSLAIANGEASPSTPLAAPNYPRDTVICDNRSSYRNGDFPPAGLMSTLKGSLWQTALEL